MKEQPPPSDPFSSQNSENIEDEQRSLQAEHTLRLREFATRVSNICGLETGGKISNVEAYRQIKALYKQLQQTRKQHDPD